MINVVIESSDFSLIRDTADYSAKTFENFVAATSIQLNENGFRVKVRIG